MIFMRKSCAKKITVILICVFLFTRIPSLYAQSSGASAKLQQRLEWNADSNAFEYKVEIRKNGKIINTYTTSENYIELQLTNGSYEYRVSVYDFLGRKQDVSEWQKIQVFKANTPEFEKVKNVAEVDISSGEKFVLPLELENVSVKTSQLNATGSGTVDFGADPFTADIKMKNITVIKIYIRFFMQYEMILCSFFYFAFYCCC